MPRIYTDVTAQDFSQGFAEAKNCYVLVDVRTEEEYLEGHIPGAVHIPFDEMDQRYKELEHQQDENILLICRSGRRSVVAAHTLAEKGFPHLFNLKGGMLKWDGPVER